MLSFLSGRWTCAGGGGLLVVVSAAVVACGQPLGGNGGQPTGPGPVYQWHADDGHDSDGHMFDGHHRENRRTHREERRDSRRDYPLVSPRVSAGWFERPYPYHLDFYRMRFGSRVGALEAPYGPTLPAYYGPYYTSAGDEATAPAGLMEQRGPLVELPEPSSAPKESSGTSDVKKEDRLPASYPGDSGKTPK